MTDSTRLRILKEISAMLESITPDNGYEHDLSAAVFRGIPVFGEGYPLPMVSILEYLRPDMVEDRPWQSNKDKVEWDLLIQGWVEDDWQNPTDPVHGLLADVKKCLSQIRDSNSSHYRLNRLPGVSDFKMDGGIVRPPEANSAKAQFYLRATVVFAEHMDNPYR